AALTLPCAEHLLQLVRRRDLELVVAALGRLLVGTPPQKYSSVPEALALHVVVLDLAHALDAHRLPREILAGAPPALPARHPRRAVPGLGPVPPRVVFQGICAQRLQLRRQLFPARHRERRRHADVVQAAGAVVEPKQEGTDVRAGSFLVPPEAGDDAV